MGVTYGKFWIHAYIDLNGNAPIIFVVHLHLTERFRQKKHSKNNKNATNNKNDYISNNNNYSMTNNTKGNQSIAIERSGPT